VRLRGRVCDECSNTCLFVCWHELDFGVKVSLERGRDLLQCKGFIFI